METLPSRPRTVKFAVFDVDLQAGEVRKHGMRLKLARQPFHVLQLLLEHPQELVTREELRQRLWPEHTFVDHDVALKKAINRIREALGDSAESPRFIETIPRRGYRFIGRLDEAVSLEEEPEAEPAAEANVDPPARKRKFTISLAFAAGGAAVLTIILGFNQGGLRDRLWGSAARAPIQSLAVLPLANLSGDPNQEYFSDGMTDALITDLAQIGSLKVISRTSSLQYKQTKKSLPEIARELGVDAVIEGTVQRSGDRVRITAQLIQGATDKHIWAGSYERRVEDVLRLQGEVTQAIATQIRAELTPAEQSRLARSSTTSVEAQQLYLKGRYFWNRRTEEGLERSLEYFQQAVENDPDYALAYAGMADSYTILAAGEYAVLPPREAVPKAKLAANNALRFDPMLAEAHASLGFLKHSFDWNWQGAEQEYKRAIELNPSYATAHHWYAIFLVEMGRFAEAVAEIKKSESLDPLSLIISSDFGWILYNERQYDSAIQQLGKTLELDSKFASGHWTLGLAYGGKGMSKEAVAELQKAVDLSGGLPVCVAALGRAYAQAGNKDEALRIVRDLQDQSKHRYVLPDGLAYIYTALGENDHALSRLEEAYAERTDAMPLLKVDPRLDPLRADPRFVALLRRVNFPH